MSLTIKQLEELIKAAPNKNLPVHIRCTESEIRATVREAKLEDKELIFIENDDEVTDSDLGIEKEDDEEDEDEDEEDEEE